MCMLWVNKKRTIWCLSRVLRVQVNKDAMLSCRASNANFQLLLNFCINTPSSLPGLYCFGEGLLSCFAKSLLPSNVSTQVIQVWISASHMWRIVAKRICISLNQSKMLQASAFNNFIAVQKPGLLKTPQPWNSQNKFKRSCSQSKRIIKSVDPKTTSLKRPQNHKTVTRHKRNHMTTSRDQEKTRAPKIYLMVLEAFKISQSPDNYASNNQLDYLKKMGISKSHDDLWV